MGTDTITTSLLFPYVFKPNVIVFYVFGHVCVMSEIVYRYIENEYFVSGIST